MPDEGAVFINQVTNNMNPVFFTGKDGTETADVSRRIGIGRGIIEVPENFDGWGGEIASLFEGKAV